MLDGIEEGAVGSSVGVGVGRIVGSVCEWSKKRAKRNQLHKKEKEILVKACGIQLCLRWKSLKIRKVEQTFY